MDLLKVKDIFIFHFNPYVDEQHKIYDNLQDPIDGRVDLTVKPTNYEFSLGNKIDTEKNFNPQSDLNFNVHNSEDFSIKQNESVIPKYYYNDTQEHKNFVNNNTNNTLNNDCFRQENHNENQINYVNTSKQSKFFFNFEKKIKTTIITIIQQMIWVISMKNLNLI